MNECQNRPGGKGMQIIKTIYSYSPIISVDVGRWKLQKDAFWKGMEKRKTDRR
jgi:hypothetical protein